MVGQTDSKRFEMHGSERGNVVLADASVSQVGVKQDFETLGWNMFQSINESKSGGNTTGAAVQSIIYSPY